MNILITAAGTGTAFSYITAIEKNFSELNIFTADTNSKEYVTSALFAEEHFVLPTIFEDKFLQKLEEIILENNIDIYIPLIDKETIKSFGVESIKNKAVINNKEFCLSCIKKDEYHNSFNNSGFYFPQKINIKNIDINKGYVLKKNGGFGGRGTVFLMGNEITNAYSEYAIYETIEGKEYTIDCFPFENKAITSIRQRAEVKNGVCTKAHILKNEILENAASDFVKRYSLEHPFCFQVIEQNKKFYLIDFNPRLGAGSAMSSVNGMDFFSAHIAKLIGKDPLKYLERHHDECIVTRQYANYLTKVL